MQTNLKSFLQRIVRQKNKRRFLPVLLALLLGLAIVQPVQAADGDLDPGFGSGGKVTTSIDAGVDSAAAVAIDANNKIVVAGTSNNGENDDFALARYNSNGTLDASFDGDGIVTTPVGAGNDAARAVVIDSSGKILVAGRSHNGANYDFALVRYNSNGTLDASFDNDGIVTTDHGNADGAWAVVVDASGKIVVAGEANVDFALLRYNSDGTLDTSFDGDGIVTTPIATGGGIGGTHDVATAVTIDGRGQIVAAGTGGGQLFELARYNNDGSLDATFDSDGKVSTDVSVGSPENARAVAVDANGKIVVAGTSFSDAAWDDFTLVRYNSDGTLDASFDGDGIVTTPVGGGHDEGYAMAIDSSGKIVVAGTSHNGQNRDFALVRYTNDGALDGDFGVGGKVTTDFGAGITIQDYGYAVAIESSGKIVVAGQVGNDFALARYSGENGPLVSHCNQQGFRAAVQSGEASGTLTLDGNCRYLLSTADDDFFGGSGAYLSQTTVVEGNGAIIERDANAPQFRILYIQVDGGTVIRNLTIRNGENTMDGGGIFVASDLTLENVTLEGNNAKADAGGGAIASFGDLTIDNSHLINNQAGYYGGAIFKGKGVLDVTDTVFAQNNAVGEGAAIFVGSAVTEATVTNSTITDNAKNDGIAVIAWAPLTLTNTIIANHHTALLAGGKSNAISEDYNLFANITIDIEEMQDIVVNRGGHSTQAPDPQFVDPAALNYALKKSSPAVDKGTDAVLVSAPNLATDAANMTRPFNGTPVDIGAFELQEQGGPSLSIIKQGPPWIAAGVQADYSLTIANDGVASAATLEVVDVLPTGAQYVAGSATNNGAFANGRLTWQIGSLAPGAKSFLQYKVTAAQTLVSDDYKVQSTSDPTVFYQGQAITSPLNTKVVADLRFYPRPDGFSFPNYTDSLDSDFTITDTIKFFGREAACISEASPCVLKASVETWRKSELDLSTGGHCAGFASASLDIFANPLVAPSDFQDGANVTYDLTKANARSFIMPYWSAQAYDPKDPPKDANGTTYVRHPITSSIQLLDTLINNFNDPNATDRYRLGIAAVNDKGQRIGHSVAPYAVEKRKDDAQDHDYLIYVYDNNYPNDTTRTIRINSETGDWAYVTALNPDAPTSTYKGGKDDDFIGLASWQFDQTFPKVCPVCPPPATAASGNIAGASVLQSSGTVEFQLDGEGYLLVTRSDGKRVGFDLTTGQWITEIEGAEAVDVLTGLGLHIPPAIRIPHEAGKTYGLQVANGDTAYGNTEASANVNIFGAGFAVRLTELVLNSPIPQPIPSGADGAVQTAALAQDPFDVMNLNFDPDAKLIVFETGDDDAETPSLSMAISKGQGPDYSVDVKNVNVEPGHAIALAFNEANQSITIEDDSAAQTNFQVEVKRINPDGTTDTFVSDNVSDGGKAGVTLKVGAGWTGAAPDIQVEENSPLLSPDDENQEHAIFLPLVAR